MILRGSMGHKVAKASLDNDEVFVGSAFDGETVGWQLDSETIEDPWATTCVVNSNRIPTLIGIREHLPARDSCGRRQGPPQGKPQQRPQCS